MVSQYDTDFLLFLQIDTYRCLRKLYEQLKSINFESDVKQHRFPCLINLNNGIDSNIESLYVIHF